MGKFARASIPIFLVAGLAGCADPNIEPVPFDLAGPSSAVVVGGNLRTIAKRPREISGREASLPTICSEPSPDVAIAFSRSFSGSASISEPSGPSGSGSVAASQNEAATALESGRTAGVLALRDGLTAACQAYVNGVIGQDAYALVLSQYGSLLVALAGTGTAGSAPPHFTAQEAALTALLVSCISEHDPTRLGAQDPSRPGYVQINRLLSAARCNRLLDGIASGRLMKASAATNSAPAPVHHAGDVAPASVTINMPGAKNS